MKQLSTTFVLALGLLTALGCDNRTDPITLMDSGPPQVDAGMTCGDPLAAPTQVACAASTAMCISECPAGGDGTCFQGCLDADPDAMNCIGCLNVAIYACSSRTACMSDWAPVDCCIAANCGETGPCLGDGEPCGTQFDTFDTCTGNADLGSDCSGVANVCFPAAGGFLPNLPRGFSPETLHGLRDALPAMSATWLPRR